MALTEMPEAVANPAKSGFIESELLTGYHTSPPTPFEAAEAEPRRVSPVTDGVWLGIAKQDRGKWDRIADPVIEIFHRVGRRRGKQKIELRYK